MKSAIFQDLSLPTQARQARKQPQKKWPRSSSPFVVPPSATSLPNWNLDDILSTYTTSGILPPPLSPTLPPRFAAKETPEQSASRYTGSDDDVDTDSLPLSLLSPTLPSMFGDTPPRTHTTTLAHPLPAKPSTVSSVLHGTAKPVKNNRVRWVDKLDDPAKPRFFLRITFSSLVDAYRQISRTKHTVENHHEKAQEPVQEEIKGLAITGLKPEPTPNVKPPSLWPKSHKEFLSRYTKLPKEGSLLSILAQFDWIVCSAIMCDSETANRQNSGASNAEPWTELLAEIPLFVHRIERFIKTGNVSDKKRSYLSFLVGVLAVYKALALKRANHNLMTSIDNISKKDSSIDAKQKTIDLQQNIIKNHRKIEDHFAESQSFFKNSPSPSTVCPKTWALRTTAIPKQLESPIVPSADPYFLPLGPYSDLGEACAFLYGCLREFADVFEIELGGGGRYHLQSGKNTRLSYD